MNPSAFATELNRLAQAIDPGARRDKTVDSVYELFSDFLGISKDEIYVVRAGTRASNLPTRWKQGRANGHHFSLGVALLGTEEFELAKKHACELADGIRYDVTAVVVQTAGAWALRIVAGARNPVSAKLATLPGAEFSHVDQQATALPMIEASASPRARADAITVSAVTNALEQRKIHLGARTVEAIVVALVSGKNLLLVGPPGTGKSTIATAIGEAATTAGVANGYLPTTATSDWTSVDTTGGYRQTVDGDLEFRPGLFLEAFARDEWLVIDELNRADIDKAVGALFTVLSGQSSVLPFEVARGERSRPVAVVPETGDVPATNELEVFTVSDNWRLIATLNDRDQDLLFTLSEAFLRRFAQISIEVPAPPEYRQLLVDRAPTGDAAADSLLAKLVDIEGLALGPAILLDCARHVAVRRELDLSEGLSAAELVREAVELYVRPQISGLHAIEQEEVRARLEAILAAPVPASEVGP